jgi:hypothetical protein
VAYTYPTVTDFKAYYVRNFPYGTDPITTIIDSDITKAIQKSTLNINQGLFSDQESFTLACTMLSAHYLALDMQSSSQGISAKMEWPTQSKSVGTISTSSAIPQRILDNPLFASLSSTSYGLDYLMMVIPLLSGQIFMIDGGTQVL